MRAPAPGEDAATRTRPHSATRFWRLTLAIAAAGVLARAVYVLALTPELSGGADWRFFHATAREIAAGGGYRLPRPLLAAQGFAAPVPTALHPPGYPFALALWSRVAGDGALALRLLGLVTGLATVVAIAAIGREIAGDGAGLASAALAATSPFLIGLDGALMSETLFAALVALAVLASYALVARPGALRAAALGAVVGAAALTRTEALLLVPILVLPATLRERSWTLAATAIAACAAVVLAWTLRNTAVFGRPILVSTNACGVIGGANCAPAYAGTGVGGWELSCLAPPSGNEAADAERWCADGIAYARAHPGALPAVLGARILRTWNLWPAAFAHVGEGQLRRVDRIAKLWLLAILPAAAAGAWLLRRRGALVWPLAAPLAMVSLAGAVGWGLPRLQAGAAPSLVALASVAVAALAHAVLRRGSR